MYVGLSLVVGTLELAMFSLQSFVHTKNNKRQVFQWIFMIIQLDLFILFSFQAMVFFFSEINTVFGFQ